MHHGKNRGLLVVGVALIAGGLLVLGWLGWQLWGTNWESHRVHRQTVESTERAWAHGARPRDGADAILRVPRFGDKYAVPILDGVSTRVLSRGVGHFQKTAAPGEVGNFALAGHRITHGEPFRRLPDLRVGDRVIIETSAHIYTYVLDTDPTDLVVPFTASWVLESVPKNPKVGGPQPAQATGQRLITLTTCSELFHTDNRMIAFGHLARVQEKA